MGSNGMKPSARSVTEIWTEFKGGGATNGSATTLRNMLMENYLPLVEFQAERIHAGIPNEQYVDLGDLISAGGFGLIDAIYAYDLSRGVKFETYCAPRIRGAILDELRAIDWIPRLTRHRARKVEKVANAFRMRFGRQPSEDELRVGLKLSEEDYNKVIGDCNVVGTFSHSRANSKESDRERSRIDFVIDQRVEDPDHELERKLLRDAITKGLDRRSRLVIILHHLEGYTMIEVAQFLFISESRVSQIHDSAIQRIKSSVELMKRTMSSEGV